MGVSERDITPDTRIAAAIVTANSCISRPTMPPMKRMGMKTAASDTVIDTIVKEISFTIVSMTVSLAAVFIPILFMGGIVGRLMHEFAVTIAAAILVSGVMSLSLTPMLCSRFLKPLHSMHHGWMYNAVERSFDAWLKGYAWTLRKTIHFKGTTMLISAAMLAGTAYLFMVIPKGFIPNVDTGQISGSVEMAQGIGYELIVQHMQELIRVLQQDSNIMAFTADAGG